MFLLREGHSVRLGTMSEQHSILTGPVTEENIQSHPKTKEYLKALIARWRTMLPEAERQFIDEKKRHVEILDVPEVTIEELATVEAYLLAKLSKWRANYNAMINLIVCAKNPPPLPGYKRVADKIVPADDTKNHAVLETQPNARTLADDQPPAPVKAESDPNIPTQPAKK